MTGPVWDAIAHLCQLLLGVVLLVAVLKLCNTLYDIELLYRSMQSDINRLRAPRVLSGVIEIKELDEGEDA